MALRKVRKNLDRLFDKNLTDLIRGIRNNKDNEARYIAGCIEEIKEELRQDSLFVKTNAIEKLAYLEMMGYDISWAAFNIIEVMASTKYTEKRIGYMVASKCFYEGMDVLMLVTNLIRKDLHSGNMYDTGVALGALSCFVTLDLARDLTNDVVNLLSSSRPYIRKRCVLMLYKIFLKYPDSLKPTFPRLKDKLEDPDPGVQSAAVNVICELARKNPKNYLMLAPFLFKLMTTSTNNWMLIKIIKLFGALVPLEPRLGKKLLEPLTNLINSTSAMSLLYECINTVIAVLICVSSGAPGDHTASIQLCVQKLGALIEDSDQNLKYLGLLAMGKILRTHPKAVQAHKDIVLRCLDDKDESIRLRTLDLLYGMVSKRNIMEIVRRLMEHVDAAEGSFYRDELLSRIISICSHNNYQYISDFEWYISVLVELTKVEGTKHGLLIAAQMQDVTVRVQSIRHFSVSQMALLVENAQLLLVGSAEHRINMGEVLLAAAWICGEYSEHMRNVQVVLEAMLKVKISVTPGHILSVFVQNIAKLYSVLLMRAEAEEDWDGVDSIDNLMLSKLPQFELVDHLEAQERACSLVALIKIIERSHSRHEKIGDSFAALFESELNPVASKAQRKVPVPEGLNLDTWIHEPVLDIYYDGDDDALCKDTEYNDTFDDGTFDSQRESIQYTDEQIQLRREQRRLEIENNPYYMKGDSKPAKCSVKNAMRDTQNHLAECITELQSPLEIPGVVGLNRYLEQQQSTLSWRNAKKVKKKRKEKKTAGSKAVESSSDDDNLAVIHDVNRADGEMPENAKSTDEENCSQHSDDSGDVFKALDVDLEQTLKEREHSRLNQNRPNQLCISKASNPNISETSCYNVSKSSEIRKTKLLETDCKDKIKFQSEKPRQRKKKKKTESQLLQIHGSFKCLDEPGAAEAVSGALLVTENSGTKLKRVKYKSCPTRRGKKNIDILEPVDKDVYEATSGICTPSNPYFNMNSFSNGVSPREDTPPLNVENSSQKMKIKREPYKLLGETKDLKLTYETRVSAMNADQIAICVVFANKNGNTIRHIEMNILDTMNLRLVRDDGRSSASVVLSFQLPPVVSAQHTFSFLVDVVSVAQRLRGTVNFFVESGDETYEDMIDFFLNFPVLSFVVPATISSDAFDLLVASSDVDYKSSSYFSSSNSLGDILQNSTVICCFSIVEKHDTSASLYAQTIKAEPICIFIKKQKNAIRIDGRSGDQQLIYSMIDELREIAS